MTNNSTKDIQDSGQSQEQTSAATNTSDNGDTSKEVKADKNKNQKNKISNKQKPISSKHALKKEKTPISKTALLALLISMLAGGALGYGYIYLQNQQQLIENLSQSKNSLDQIIRETQQSLNSETLAREKIQADYVVFKTAMEALATKLGRTSNEWRLAEIEYLLTVANHRLSLANDLETAITIFETADQRIQSLGDPALLKIRKQIKDEIVALRTVKQPDITGMALSLGSLIAEVEKLPLIDKERVAVATGQVKDQAPESWQDIPAAVWKDIKSLVVVRRHQKATEPLLPPAEAWFLHQNLRLKLEQARLSLLRRETGLFQQQLKEAGSWIRTFFNEESSGVLSALKQISTLSAVELQPKNPEVSDSLLQLRSLLAERGVKIGSE